LVDYLNHIVNEIKTVRRCNVTKSQQHKRKNKRGREIWLLWVGAMDSGSQI